VAGNTTIPGSPAGAIDNLLNWNGDSLKPPFNVTGKSTTDETQYAAYLATRLHATDDLSILLGSRVVDWHRDIEDKPYAAHTKTEESETGVYIPYAGVVYDVNDTWSLYASYTKIFNPQSPGFATSTTNRWTRWKAPATKWASRAATSTAS
jgi:outer membrane receptor for ferric coprogen and ferric-rhodotorulic acid